MFFTSKTSKSVRFLGSRHARSQISALLASFVMRFDMDLVTNEEGNRMPEDHDGPFVFDTANSLKLVNLRPRAGEISSKVGVSVAAAAFGAPKSSTSCPFSGMFKP